MSRMHRATLAAVLVALAAVYARTLAFDATTHDDEAMVFKNPAQLHFGAAELREMLDPRASRLTWGLQYTPIRDASYVVDRLVFGDDAGPYHLQGILLHTLATAALFVLVARLGGTAPVAGVAAAVFALHPLQVESVAWISGRTVPLAGAFLLLAMLAWQRARTAGGTAAYLAALAFVALGLEVGRREGIIAPAPRDAATEARLVLAAVGWYVRAFAWPLHLLPAYRVEAPPSWIDPGLALGAAALVLAGAVVVRARRHAPLVLLGTVIAVLAILPGAHGLGTQVVADRYAYLGVAGAGILTAFALQRATAHAPRLAPVVATLLLVAMTATAAERVGVWRNDLALYGDARATEPDNPLWTHMLGRALGDAGRGDDGLALAQQAVTMNDGQPVGGYCPLPPVLTEVALLRERQGDLAAAEATLVEALDAARPGEVDRAGVDLGAFYLRQGDRQRARAAYAHAVEREPDAARLSRARVAWLDGLLAREAAAALPGDEGAAHNAPVASPSRNGGEQKPTRGGVYYDPNDSRVIVPKITGPGWTINFAHPLAIPALLVALTLAVGPGLLLLWSGHATTPRLVLVEALGIGALIALSMWASRGA